MKHLLPKNDVTTCHRFHSRTMRPCSCWNHNCWKRVHCCLRKSSWSHRSVDFLSIHWQLSWKWSYQFDTGQPAFLWFYHSHNLFLRQKSYSPNSQRAYHQTSDARIWSTLKRIPRVFPLQRAGRYCNLRLSSARDSCHLQGFVSCPAVFFSIKFPRSYKRNWIQY